MPFPLIPLIIGAIVGAGKHALSDAPRAAANRRANAAMTKYSPWTGMKGEVGEQPDAFGTILSTGLTGAMFSQAMGKDGGGLLGGGTEGGGTESAWSGMQGGPNKYSLGADYSMKPKYLSPWGGY